MHKKFTRLGRIVAAAASLLIATASPALAVTTIGTDITTDGVLTVNGNVNFNDAGADTLLIGQNGGTPDVVTIAGNVSLTDTQWAVTAAGAATFVSLDLSNGSISNLGVSGASLTRAGAHALTLTTTNTTNVTLPTTGTLATLAGTETLLSKTLTSPRIGTSILDTNGNELMLLTATASAVNEMTLENGATGNPVKLSATGDDAAVNFQIHTKGTNSDLIISNSVASMDRLRIRSQSATGSGTFDGIITTADLTTATKTWTFPDRNGTVSLSGDTFTGDVTGTLNTSGATALTIATDSVALTTDTTGNYVTSVGTSVLTGLTGGAAASEGATLTLALDYSQALTGDVGLAAHAAVFGQSGLVFEGSAADTSETFLVITNPTADRTLTFPDASGNVAVTAGTLVIASGKTLTANNSLTFAGGDGSTLNFPAAGGVVVLEGATQVLINKTLTDSTTLFQDEADNTKKLALQLSGISTSTTRTLTIPDANGTICLTSSCLSSTLSSANIFVGNGSNVATGVAMSGDVTIDNTGATTIGTDKVALTTDTTGNYVTSVGTSVLTGLTGGAAASEGATLTLALDYSQPLTGDVNLAPNTAVFGQSGLVFEGSTADTIETFFAITNPTASDKTITFPNATITVNAAADISGTTLASTVVSSSLTSVGTLTGLTVNGTLTLANAETLDAATNSTFSFSRNDAGVVTLTSNDGTAATALTILPKGAAGLTLGGGSMTALTVTTDGVGDAEVALPAQSISSTEITDGSVSRGDMTAAAAAQHVQAGGDVTIATTGTADFYVIVPESGTLSNVDFSGVETLATSDTNYVTFSITNLGQNGLGTAVMLAATDANTTKATGGSAITANAKRTLTLTGTGGDLVVVKGDRLRVRAAVTGTLANSVTFSTWLLTFGGTN